MQGMQGDVGEIEAGAAQDPLGLAEAEHERLLVLVDDEGRRIDADGGGAEQDDDGEQVLAGHCGPPSVG